MKIVMRCVSVILTANSLLFIQSFAGVGLATDTLDVLVRKVTRNKKVAERWRMCRVLIIDEISMIGSDLFDMLDRIAKEVRRSEHPFGGIQVVCTGDFLQLPPVNPSGEVKYCFQAQAWREVIRNTIELRQVFRQTVSLVSSIDRILLVSQRRSPIHRTKPS